MYLHMPKYKIQNTINTEIIAQLKAPHMLWIVWSIVLKRNAKWGSLDRFKLVMLKSVFFLSWQFLRQKHKN